MKEIKNIRSKIRDFYTVETLKTHKIVTDKFSESVKIESLSNPIVSINTHRKNRNTQIWVADEFGNSVSLSKLTDNDCRLIFEQILKDKIYHNVFEPLYRSLL